MCLWGGTALVAMASLAPPQGKPAMPDDLYFDFKPIPADQNAIIDWRRAAEAEVKPNDKQRDLLRFCWTPGAPEPRAEDLDDLRTWLKRNREALGLFDASLAKPKAQWPDRSAQTVQVEIAGFSYLMRARLLEADQLAAQNQFEAAAKLLEDNLKLAEMAIHADPGLIHYFLGCSGRTLTQDAILRLAARKQLSLSIRERLLSDLPSLDFEAIAYTNALRSEFAAQYHETIDLKKLSDDWSKLPSSSATMLRFPDDCVRPFKVLLDPSLVPMHPNPLDQNSEIEKTIRHFRICYTNSFSAWSNHSDEANIEAEQNHSNLLRDISPLMKLVENEPLPLSRQAAQRARTTYLAITNPVGRIWDCTVTESVGSDVKVFRCRTEREATRAVLALLIFERRKGVLPAKLSDLVDEKILKSVPNDPFSGNPIQYSRERQIVWSVGQNGLDDDGQSGPSRWAGDDAVWPIPQLN